MSNPNIEFESNNNAPTTNNMIEIKINENDQQNGDGSLSSSEQSIDKKSLNNLQLTWKNINILQQKTLHTKMISKLFKNDSIKSKTKILDNGKIRTYF
jgi:hypothetical protein